MQFQAAAAGFGLIAGQGQTQARAAELGSMAATLAAAVHEAERLRIRVTLIIVQAGWTMLVVGLTPTFLLIGGIDLGPTIGPFTYYVGISMWGVALLPLVSDSK